MNYMNLFEHYRHDIASIPLENNLTRIFARILNDNYYVTDAFFRLVNKKLIDDGIGNIYDDVDDQIVNVDIQKTIGKLNEDLSELTQEERYNKVIGIALTAENINFNNEEVNDATEQQRPDIYVMFNNYNFIIEAKKTCEDCSKQLKEYIKAIVQNGKDNNIKNNYNNYKLVSVSWDEIVSILEKAKEMKQSDLIVDEYLEYLNNHFSNLFDVRPLKKALQDQGEINKTLFNKRIDYALSNIISYFNDGIYSNNNNSGGVLYLKDDKYQQRISFEDVDIISSQYVIKTWIADTKSQLWYFIDSKKTLSNKKNKYSVYLKLADTYGRGRLWIPCLNDLDEVNINDISKCYEFCGRGRGEQLYDRIAKICDTLKVDQNIYANNEELKGFINNEKVLSASLGIEVENRIPINLLIDYDTDFDKNNAGNKDNLAKMLNEYIKENLII